MQAQPEVVFGETASEGAPFKVQAALVDQPSLPDNAEFELEFRYSVAYTHKAFILSSDNFERVALHVQGQPSCSVPHADSACLHKQPVTCNFERCDQEGMKHPCIEPAYSMQDARLCSDKQYAWYTPNAKNCSQQSKLLLV